MAERNAAGRGEVWCVGGVRVCCWKRKMELLSWRRGEAVAEGEAAVLVVVCGGAPWGRRRREMVMKGEGVALAAACWEREKKAKFF